MNENNRFTKNNLALALGGGAARGAFHLGVLHYCEQNNIEIQAYSGSSIGAIISISHASGVKAKELLNIFKAKETKQAIKFNYFKNGLLKIDHNHKIIDEIFPIKKIEDIKKPVYVNAYDLKEKKLHYFDRGDVVQLSIASSALIPLFKPVKYQNMKLIDGGLFDNVPIKPLENKNYHIYAIDLFPKRKNTTKKRTSLNPLKAIKKRVLKDLYTNHAYTLENTNYYLATPHIRNYSMFTFKELDECFNLGFKEAQNHFLDIL